MVPVYDGVHQLRHGAEPETKDETAIRRRDTNNKSFSADITLLFLEEKDAITLCLVHVCVTS